MAARIQRQLIAVTAAINFNPKGSRLRPGEKAVVMCIACDREQAGNRFQLHSRFFRAGPGAGQDGTEHRQRHIELTNSVVIEVHTNSYRSVRGRSILCAIFDEVASGDARTARRPTSKSTAPSCPVSAAFPAAR